LDYFTKRLEYRVVKNRCEKEVDIFQIDSVLIHLFLQLYLVLVTGILLRQVDISLIDKDENRTTVGVLCFEILVKIEEVIQCFKNISLRIQHENQGGCVIEYHGLIGRRIACIIAGRKVVEFELDFLDFEVVSL
jgi:hypothetical protein